MSCLFSMAQPQHEKRIYYLDVTESMKGYNGSPNIWKKVCSNLKDAVRSIKKAGTIIEVYTFTDRNHPIYKVGSRSFRPENIEELCAAIDTIKTRIDYTDISLPFEDFYINRIDDEYINCFFLLTDGEHKVKGGGKVDLEKNIRSWNEQTQKHGQYVYGFHVMLTKISGAKEMANMVQSQKHLWSIETAADIKINLIKPHNTSIFNIRGDKSFDINFDGFLSDFINWNIQIEKENEYFKNIAIKKKNDSIIEVFLEPRKDTIEYKPVEELKLSLNIENSPSINKDFYINREKGEYNFLIEQDLTLKILSKPENRIRCIFYTENSIEDNDTCFLMKQWYSLFPNSEKVQSIGIAHYYPSFCWEKDSLTNVFAKISFELSPDAKKNRSWAKFQFIDNTGNPIDTTCMKIVVDKDTNEFVINHSECDSMVVKDICFVFSKNANKGVYNGYIQLIDHNNLDRINGHELNGDKIYKMFPWTIEYDKHLNPLLKNILWIFVIVLILCLLYLLIRFIIKSNKPTFPDNKIMVFENENNKYLFDSPKLTKDVILEGNNSPLIVKGYSNIYIAHSKQRNGYLKQLILTDKEGWSSSKNFWGGWTYMIGANLPRKIRQITISPLDKVSLKLNIFYVDKPKEEEMILNYDQIENSNIPYTGIFIHFENGVINNINN